MSSRTWTATGIFLILGGAFRLLAATFEDGFSNGLDRSSWQVISNTPLYTIDDSQGDVRLSKPVGGSYTLQYVGAELRHRLQGDFDVRLDFRDAAINRQDGFPGNQVQLALEFGSQLLALVRSDEGGFGHNVHVFVGPPNEWRGTQATTTTSGTLRIRRVGLRVSAYLDATLVYEADFNREDARAWFTLQNNGTRDATAVTFDTMAVTADAILPPPVYSVDWHTVDGGGGRSVGARFSVQGTVGQPDASGHASGGRFSVGGGFWQAMAVQQPGAPRLRIRPAGPGRVRISWSPPDPGWVLQETTSLTSPAWRDSPSGATNPVLRSTAMTPVFFRLTRP